MGAERKEVPLEDYLGHGEKILVVDDEERQREIASGMLTELGHNAESVSSGEAAIEYVKENPVDLIVLDMVMPKGINGRKTYEEIIKINPGQKTIIASGFAKTKEVDLAQELGAGNYIKKPTSYRRSGLQLRRNWKNRQFLTLGSIEGFLYKYSVGPEARRSRKAPAWDPSFWVQHGEGWQINSSLPRAKAV